MASQRGWRQGVQARPLSVLLLALAVNAAIEVGRTSGRLSHAKGLIVAQALVSAAALLLVRRNANRLQLVHVLVLALAMNSFWVLVHLHYDVRPDSDTRYAYPLYGNQLLDGNYPRADYPTLAVGLFAFESWIGDGKAYPTNAWLMVPFTLLGVAAVWSLRTRWSAWLATIAAVWPVNLYHWEYRFDAAPAALLAVGLVLAYRGRWWVSGAMLGLGAALKWTPAVAMLALLAWLVSSGRFRDAWRHTWAAASVFALATLPFLAFGAKNVLVAYELQGDRSVTSESAYYIPLRLAGLARVNPSGHFWDGAVGPGWMNGVAIAIQLAALVVLTALAARKGVRQTGAVAIAALLPASFMLANRVWSPQYAVVLVVAWAIAAGLAVQTTREQLVAGAGILAATLANTMVYPLVPSWWFAPSTALFLTAFALTGWMAVRATADGPMAVRLDMGPPGLEHPCKT